MRFESRAFRSSRRLALFSVLALLAPGTSTSAQASVLGWGETISNSAWNTGHYAAIAAGNEHTVALRSDGTVVAWGDNTGNVDIFDTPSGQCSDIPPLPPGLFYRQVSAGAKHSVGLRSDGVAVVWGHLLSSLSPPQPRPCVEIAAGSYHTVARLDDGSVTVGGSGEPPAPALPAGLTYVEIAAGGGHSLARRSDGAVVAWGRQNDFGQCNVPALPSGLTYVEIAAGRAHSVARRSDGSVVAWGDNRLGQCNVLALPAGLVYIDIEAGGNHTLARRSDRSAVAWGDDSRGQCDIPVLPAGLVYVELAAGGLHSVGRRDDGSVVAWGDNGRDQCNGAPVPPAGVSYRQITPNRVALFSDGSVVAWSGTRASPLRAVPALPAGLTYVEVASVAQGDWAMARRSDGSVVAWGNDHCGVLVVPALPLGLSYVEIAPGAAHGLALRSDGSVVGWGCNGGGQCDVPALPPGLAYIQIAAGGEFSVACRSDGAVVTWGRSRGTQDPFYIPALPADVRYVEVALSSQHMALRRSDGAVVAFMQAWTCCFPLPPAGLSYVEVAAAWQSSTPPTAAVTVARLSDGSVVSYGPGTVYPYPQRLPAPPVGFSCTDIAATPGVTFALLEPTTTTTVPALARVTPAPIDALVPGTNQTIALDGTGLDLVTTVLLDDVAIAPARYRIVSSALILLDMPQTASLGAHEITVSDGAVDVSMNVTVVAPATPKYELGSGDALNVVERRDGLSYIVAGPVGSVQRVYVSLSNLPSTSPYGNLALGDQFASLFFVGQYAIPAAGWLEVTTAAAALPLPGVAGITFYSQTLELAPGPFRASNLQSIQLVQRAGSIRRP